MRRCALAAGGAAAVSLIAPAVASAHGLAQRENLPIP
jgi:hypothetical protein